MLLFCRLKPQTCRNGHAKKRQVLPRRQRYFKILQPLRMQETGGKGTARTESKLKLKSVLMLARGFRFDVEGHRSKE